MVRPFYAFAVLGVLGCLPACQAELDTHAADSGGVPVSALFADEAREVFRLSPEGSLVAFLHFDGLVNRLCVGDPGDLAATTLTVTGPDDGSIFSFFWVGDSQIAFAARRQDQQTLIGSALLPHSLTEQGPADIRVRVLGQGADSGKLAGAISKGGRTRILVAPPSGKGDGISDIVAVDPATGERELIHRNVEALPIWTVSKNGETLAGIRCSPDGGKELVGVHAGETKGLLKCGPDESLEIEGIDNQGAVIYAVTNQGDNAEFARLVAIDIATGKRAVIGKNPRQEADLCEAVFDRDTSRVLACRFYRDRPEYLWLSADSEKLFDDIHAKLPEGDIRLRDSSTDGKRWLVSVTRDTEPDAEYFYESETKRLVRLDSRATPIPAASLGRMKAVRYPARDKQVISAYLTLPAGGAESDLPVVVFPHGGPNKRNYWGYDARVQFFASRGYAVFQPNFRGSSGFGKTFQNAGNGQWGRGVMQDDISDGVAWLVGSGIADPGRVAIVGGSYGGFAALAGVAFTPDLYACGVCMFGASDLADFVRDIPDDWKPFHGDIAAKIGNPALPEGKRRLAWQSPANFTSQIRAPLLVYHGARDRLVRKSQADRFVGACRTSGADVDYLVSAGEGHGFTDPLDEQAVYVAIERFLSAHIGGRTQRRVPADVEARLEEMQSAARSWTPLPLTSGD